MMKKKPYDPVLLENIASNIFSVLPLLKKHPLQISALQSEQGIPVSQVQVLSMLSERDCLSVSEISKRLGIAKPNITPLVDKLVNEGYVDRVRDTVDRRVVNVMLMPAGRDKLESIRMFITEQVGAWVEPLSIVNLRELNDALSTISRLLSLIS